MPKRLTAVTMAVSTAARMVDSMVGSTAASMVRSMVRSMVDSMVGNTMAPNPMIRKASPHALPTQHHCLSPRPWVAQCTWRRVR